MVDERPQRTDLDDAGRGMISAEAAELYERFFVPALFEQWPDRLLTEAGVGPGHTVLDVGCGTGVLARAALDRVGPSGRVIGMDPSEGMLEVAARTAPGITWIRSTAETLDLDGEVDRVVSQFALMFFDDPRAALVAMERALRPGGRLVLLTWAQVADSPGYAELVRLIRRVVGEAPADALLVPFRIGTEAALADLLSSAFSEVTVERWQGTARFPSLQSWLQTDVHAWTLRDLISAEEFARLAAAAPEPLARFVGADGVVSFAAPALVATATAPA